MDFAGAFNAGDNDGVENETFEYAPLDGEASSSPQFEGDESAFFRSPSEKTPEFSNRYSFDNPLYGSVNDDFGSGGETKEFDGSGDDDDVDDMKKTAQQQSGLNNNQL